MAISSGGDDSGRSSGSAAPSLRCRHIQLGMPTYLSHKDGMPRALAQRGTLPSGWLLAFSLGFVVAALDLAASFSGTSHESATGAERKASETEERAHRGSGCAASYGVANRPLAITVVGFGTHDSEPPHKSRR